MNIYKNLLFYFCIIFTSFLTSDGYLQAETFIGSENPKQYPLSYQVSVQSVDKFCGGGIISDYFVLTAAQCVHGIPPPFTVVPNSINLYLRSSLVLNVVASYVPSQYSPGSVDYDIAVLKLNRSLEAETIWYLKTLLLPRNDAAYDGQVALVADFGREFVYNSVDYRVGEYNEEIYSDYSFYVAQVKIVNLERCKQAYSGQISISSLEICGQDKHKAEKGEEAYCNGDNGSPLVIHDVVIGILSNNEHCEEVDKPGIYTNVFHFNSFIEAVIAGEKDPSILETVYAQPE